MLNPCVRVLWRGPDSVQLELGERAVVLEGAAAQLISALAGPDQRPPRPGLASSTSTLLDVLAQHGFLWSRQPPEDDPRLAPPRPRLAGELGALTARVGERAAELLSARRCCSVLVQGTGRVATHVAALLAAAGVGRVHLPGPGSPPFAEPVFRAEPPGRATGESTVTLRQVHPGGLAPEDEGRPFTVAAEAAIRRAAPDVLTDPLPSSERPDLVVLAHDRPLDPQLRDRLHALDWAHLSVGVGPAQGTVGPLVIPGLTSCLRCQDLHRADRDAAWPLLALQLSLPRRRAPAADAALSTVVAGVAALQALSFLDGTPPATVDGSLEMHPPDWRLRRRSWPTHEACECHRPDPPPPRRRDLDPDPGRMGAAPDPSERTHERQ